MTTETVIDAPQGTQQTDAIESQAAQAPAADAPGADAQQPQGEQQGEQKPDLTPEQRAMRKMERRIHTLTAGRGAAQREAEMLRERLAAFEAQRPAQAQQEGTEPQQRPAIDPKEIDRIATQRAEELAHQRDIARRAQEVAKVGSKLDGFDDAVNTVAEEIPFADRAGRPTPFIEAVLDSEAPAAILHYLGQNPEEAAEFVGLTPAQIGRRIAKLETKLATSPKQQTSSAPRPLKPVQPNGAGEKDPSRMTDAEFAAWRKTQIAKRNS
jgi:hypothetical protein